MNRRILTCILLAIVATPLAFPARAEILKHPAKGAAMLVVTPTEAGDEISVGPCVDQARTEPLTSYVQNCLLRLTRRADATEDTPDYSIETADDRDCVRIDIRRPGSNQSLTIFRFDATHPCSKPLPEGSSITTIIVGSSTVTGAGACSVIGGVGESC